MKTLTLMADDSPSDPLEYTGWKLCSFNRRHVGYQGPDEFLPPSLGLRRKLEVGTAFMLSYYEHGLCRWSLQGQGPQCQWDTTRTAGILLWEGDLKDLPKGYDKREKWAESMLETYTCWCNGEVYGYSIEEDGVQGDSCFGFYGNDLDYMAEQVRGLINGDEVEIEGDAKDLAAYHDFTSKPDKTKPPAKVIHRTGAYWEVQRARNA